jgi:hypothetical protein
MTKIDMMSFTKSFLSFENDNQLFSYSVKNHCFWEYIRYKAFYDILNSLTAEFRSERKVKPKRLLFGGWGQLLKYYLGFRKKYDLAFINTGNIKSIQSQKGNIYNYHIIKYLSSKYKILLIDLTSQNYELALDYPCDTMYLRPVYFIDRFKAFFSRYSSKDQKIFRLVKQKIEVAFSISINIQSLVRNVFSLHRYQFDRFKKLFKKCKPKIVLYSDNGSMKSVIEATHDLGIPSVDLQHSLISFLNIIYNYQQPNDAILLSDYIFTFGSYWHQEIRVPVSKHAVGFPYFENERKNVTKWNCSRNDPEKSIVVITTGSFSRNIFASIAIDLAKMIPDYTIYFKLRNDDYSGWKSRYPAELSTLKNLVVVDNDRETLYDYFNNCRYQIGISSTALFEGMGFGLFTFVIKAGWYQEMQHLVDLGTIHAVSSASEIMTILKKKDNQRSYLNVEEIFRQNSLENIENCIEEIIFKKRNQHAPSKN